MRKILFIFGTRPEAIKMIPVIKAFRASENKYQVKICVTAQHREMLDSVLKFFSVRADYDLDLMRSGQSLFSLTGKLIHKLEPVLQKTKPDLVFVQGDTTSAFAGALAAHYMKIPVAHIEAGLRSFNKFSPFPEEMNRVLISRLADFHFAPTKRAADYLKEEGIRSNVWITGNTVIDALQLGLKIINTRGEGKFIRHFRNIDFGKKIILVTGHRRESFGKPFKEICLALKQIAGNHPETEIVYPVHRNPNVQTPVYSILGNTPGIHLIPPQDYPHFIWLMKKSSLILTDSGGVQEEAPSLGKPVLVMRDVTERTEGIRAGTARLVGTKYPQIAGEIERLLTDPKAFQSMAKKVNPYGDGKAALRIVSVIDQYSK